MMFWALVNQDKVCSGVIVADKEFIGSDPPCLRDCLAVVYVGEGDVPEVSVGPGWSWSGGEDFKPPPDPKEEDES